MITQEELDRDYDTLSLEQLKAKHKGNEKELRDALRQNRKWNAPNSLTAKWLEENDDVDILSDRGESIDERPQWLDDVTKINPEPETEAPQPEPEPEPQPAPEYKTPAVEIPEPEPVSKKSLRKQYSNDNAAYLKALKENNLSPVDQSKNKYKIKSIQDAYYDGEIDKNTRDYLMADTLAKFAGNLGRSFGNIRAQLTGGTVDNTRDDSLWNQRNKSMMEEAVGAERNEVTGSTAEQNYRKNESSITSVDLQNARERLSQVPARRFMDDAANFREQANNTKDPQEKADLEAAARLFELVGSGSLNGVDVEEYIAAFAASEPGGMELIKNLANTGNEVAKALAGIADAAGGLVGTVNEFLGGGKKVTVDEATKKLAEEGLKKPATKRTREENEAIKKARKASIQNAIKGKK